MGTTRNVGKADQFVRKLSLSTSEVIPYLVKSVGTVKLEPRARQIVMGNLEMPKRQEPPQLVCVEQAQIPLEGIIASRGISTVHTSDNDLEDITHDVTKQL
jgi:hypothetical protein